MWPLAHTAFRMFPSSAHSHLCRSHPNLRHPQTCSSFLFAHLDISLPGGRPGVGGSGRGLCSLGKQPSLSESSPSSPRWLCHAHPRACEAWSGRGGEQGPPQARGPPPPAPCHAWKHMPGAPRARLGRPCDPLPGVPWPFPSAGDGPLGTSLPGPRASLQLRPPPFSLCSLLVIPHGGAETSRPPARPLAPPGRG